MILPPYVIHVVYALVWRAIDITAVRLYRVQCECTLHASRGRIERIERNKSEGNKKDTSASNRKLICLRQWAPLIK